MSFTLDRQAVAIAEKADVRERLAQFGSAVERRRLRQTEAPLGSIEISSDGRFSFNGKPLPISKRAELDLIELLSLDPNTVRTIESSTSRAARNKMLQSVLNSIDAKSQEDIALFHSAETRKVERITSVKDANRGIDPAGLMNLIEETMTYDEHLRLVGWHVGADGEIRATFVNLHDQINLVPDMPNEMYKFGFQINQSAKGTEVVSTGIRLICSNGMYGTAPVDKLSINRSMGTDEWNDFYRKFQVLRDRQWVPSKIAEGILEASNVNASVRELMTVRKWVQGPTDLKGDKLETEFPIGHVKEAYLRKKVDLDNCSNQQLRTADTGMSKWDLINNLTDFASHSHRSDMSSSSRYGLLHRASTLLEKHDLTNVMQVNPFSDN